MELSEDLLTEATTAYDAAMEAGAYPAQALGAAAAAVDEHIVDVFNALLAADVLRFVAVDRPNAKSGLREGRPLVRVVDADGGAIVDGKLIKR